MGPPLKYFPWFSVTKTFDLDSRNTKSLPLCLLSLSFLEKKIALVPEGANRGCQHHRVPV